MTDSLGLHTDSFCLFIGLCLNPRLSCWWEIPRGECIGFFFHQVESVASRKAAGWQEFVIPKHIYSWLEVAQLLGLLLWKYSSTLSSAKNQIGKKKLQCPIRISKIRTYCPFHPVMCILYIPGIPRTTLRLNRVVVELTQPPKQTTHH